MRAFVFPGQGSQKIGMGVDLAAASPAARAVFEEVDDALGQKLFAIMRDGPEEELLLTANAQPAIMANAIAVLRVLEQEGGITLADKADFVAGHSLGEYTALCAAGAFSLADTARLLRLRGAAMRRRCQLAWEQCARCWGPIFPKRRPWPMLRLKEKSAPSPTTMIQARLCCQAIVRRLSALWPWSKSSRSSVA